MKTLVLVVFIIVMAFSYKVFSSEVFPVNTKVPNSCVKLCSYHEDAKATWITHRGEEQCYCEFPKDERFDSGNPFYLY